MGQVDEDALHQSIAVEVSVYGLVWRTLPCLCLYALIIYHNIDGKLLLPDRGD